ncbi:hypothetical protein [Wolbachia endosymbiont of Kradibia gibbosae]
MHNHIKNQRMSSQCPDTGNFTVMSTLSSCIIKTGFQCQLLA